MSYIVIIKDNFATALWHLILHGGGNDATESGIVSFILKRQDLVTWIVSGSMVLPLCFLRDMAPLEKASVVKIFSVISILTIVIYLYVANPNDSVRVTGGSTFEHWFQVRPGILERYVMTMLHVLMTISLSCTYVQQLTNCMFQSWHVCHYLCIAAQCASGICIAATGYPQPRYL